MGAVVAPKRGDAPLRRRAASRHELAFARDVLAGLAAPRKSIPGRWRLDARGLALHDAIERSDAASPTRLERSLLGSAATPIAELAGADASLVALGDEDEPGPALLRAALERLVVAPSAGRVRRRILFVPASVSAAMPSDAAMSARLRDAARHGRHDLLIVAAAAQRDPASIAAADAEHAVLRSELDRNLLVRIRRELGADLDPEAFDRQVRFDPQHQCVETTLVSRGSQRIRVLGRSFDFADGEPIVVERAYQHCLPRFEHLARDAGWSHAQLWIDWNARVAVHVLERN
jgi:uncharacterized SAM-dependent methyltransferase